MLYAIALADVRYLSSTLALSARPDAPVRRGLAARRTRII